MSEFFKICVKRNNMLQNYLIIGVSAHKKKYKFFDFFLPQYIFITKFC